MECRIEKDNWRSIYPLLIGVVNPRPIALVSTLSAAGGANLAPFSFFNLVSGNPPVVVLGPALHPDQSEKDTLGNLQETEEFVISIVTADIVEATVACGAALPADQSEFDFSGLTPQPAQVVGPPRVAESRAHLECRLRQLIRLGDGPSGGNLVLGDVLALHVDDAVLDASGRVDPRRLSTVGRLGGKWYCSVHEPFELSIPRLEE